MTLIYLALGGISLLLLRTYKMEKYSGKNYNVVPQDARYPLPEDQWCNPVPGQKLDADGTIHVEGIKPVDVRPEAEAEGVIVLSQFDRSLRDLGEEERVEEFKRLNDMASYYY